MNPYNGLILLLAFINIALAATNIKRITPSRQLPLLSPQPPPPLQSPYDTDTPSANTKLLPLDIRSISDWKLTDLLLVSDIDGNLHGVERNTGGLLWTLPIEDPLVKISANTSNGDNESTSNVLWFVEPYLDGSLYYFSPKFGLNQLPTSIKNLVLESPFSLSGDDKIYTGSRRTSLYTLNIHTGKIQSTFGTTPNDNECPVPNVHRDRGLNKDNKSNKKNLNNYNFNYNLDSDTIMLGKTTYELSIFLKENTNMVWNVTYSQWGPNNIDNDLILQNQQSLDKLYFTPFHDKSLLGINKDLGTPVWISKLPSLAVNVFDVFQSQNKVGSTTNGFVCLPHPLKVLNELQLSQDEAIMNNNDLVFINKTVTSNEWFAMSYQNYPTLIKSAPVSLFQNFVSNSGSATSSTTETERIKNFQILKEEQNEVENLINGIHKVFRLNSETFYQPHLVWDETNRVPINSLKEIGEKEETPTKLDELIPVTKNKESILNDGTTGVPSIMEGIWFPNHNNGKKTQTDGLMLLDSDSYAPMKTTPKTHQVYEVEDTTSVKSLNLIKRICEDIIVILVLLVLLMSFGRMGKITRRFASIILGWEIPNDNKEKLGDSQEPSTFKQENIEIEVPPSINIENEFSAEVLTSVDTKIEELVDAKEEVVELSKEVSSSPESTEGAEIIKKVSLALPGLDNVNPSDPVDEEGQDFNSKKKRKRGSRGGKRGGKSKRSLDDDSSNLGDDESPISADSISTKSLIQPLPTPVNPVKKLQIENNLILSDKILGYGSHGTVVFQGAFENRPVAVKRMLLDFFDIASHEVRLLQESDDHPNVIRYFCSQLSELEKFLYIALELCICSLEDIVEKPGNVNLPGKWRMGGYPTANGMLLQLASGLHYLHLLKIVHRDLKPQNILVGEASKRPVSKKIVELEKTSDTENSIRLLISDFGLCKKLDADQSSFRATTQHAALGTSGWRAPELLLHHDLLEISPDTISSINSQNGTNHSVNGTSSGNSSSNGGGKRLTKAIDIFSLGCVYFYILTGGNHPFGDRYLREANIIKGDYDLSILKQACLVDHVELVDLISSMINHNPRLRPDTHEIMKHPFFWSTHKKLEFLLKVSDRFEIERRDPPSELLLKLEEVSGKVCQLDWHSRMDEEFLGNLGKYRKYQTSKLMDLLRALRNKYHHFNDMPEHLQKQLSPLPHGFYNYFNSKFPHMLMEIYFVVRDNLKEEHLFEDYY